MPPKCFDFNVNIQARLELRRAIVVVALDETISLGSGNIEQSRNIERALM